MHNTYSIREHVQQDAVTPSHVGGETPAPTPTNKQIPKIALNFTKWKLQRNMVTDLRGLTDPVEI